MPNEHERRGRPAWLRRGRLIWAPGDIAWRTAVLFMVGSACFAAGSFPPLSSALPATLVGVVFFVGSLFFTTAGYSQYVQSINRDLLAARRAGHPDAPGARLRRFAWQPHRVDWWSCVVQSVGTLWFNVNTFAALQQGWTTQQQNVRVWAPDYVGSLCFLFASQLAMWEVCGKPACVCRGETDWWISVINMIGSVFFMVSATAAFVVPSTGTLLDATEANTGTFVGAVCFFWAARLLVKEDARDEEQPSHQVWSPSPP